MAAAVGTYSVFVLLPLFHSAYTFLPVHKYKFEYLHTYLCTYENGLKPFKISVCALTVSAVIK